jgi:Na+/melibiose symporter-like transporter
VANSRAWRMWGSLGGLAFVVLFVIGSALIFDGPNGDEPAAKYVAFYGDSSHRDKINIGWLLAGLGVFFFLWFVASLRETVREATVASADSMLAFLVTIGGTAYGAVTLVALGQAAGVRTMSDDTFQHQVFPGIIHANDDGVYVAHATGTAALAAMIFAFSLTVLATRALPRWIGWFGVVAAVAALASIFFVTMFVWLLWIAVTSVVMFFAARRGTGMTNRDIPRTA